MSFPCHHVSQCSRPEKATPGKFWRAASTLATEYQKEDRSVTFAELEGERGVPCHDWFNYDLQGKGNLAKLVS